MAAIPLSPPSFTAFIITHHTAIPLIFLCYTLNILLGSCSELYQWEEVQIGRFP